MFSFAFGLTSVSVFVSDFPAHDDSKIKRIAMLKKSFIAVVLLINIKIYFDDVVVKIFYCVNIFALNSYCLVGKQNPIEITYITIQELTVCGLNNSVCIL